MLRRSRPTPWPASGHATSASSAALRSRWVRSRPWLAGYIDGGFYMKNLCIQEYSARVA